MTTAHDDLYVVSDLHIGDHPERSIFQDTERLAGFIAMLAELTPERDIALVLGGDIVDFLAEEPPRRFDPVGSLAKLEGIIGSYRPVFDALKIFTARDRRRLVLLVGNHDVELGIPATTERLLEAVCGDAAARGRVHLGLDGQGYRCTVGGRSVFTVHGNEVDTWNIVDHEAVRRAGAAMERGLAPPVWEGNPGGTLVVEVMNDVKRKHPFVDLLKPEDASLFGVLIAIDPSVALKITKLPDVAARGPIAYLKQHGWLSVDALPTPTVVTPGARRAPSTALSADAEIAAAMARNDAGAKPTDLLDQLQNDNLDFSTAIVSRLMGRPDPDALRDAMQKWLDRVRDEFDTSHEDDTARALDAAVSPSTDIVIAGHTHLRRALVRTAEGRSDPNPAWYFNSGTWITLFDISPAKLADAAAFAPVWESLQSRTPRELLAMPDPVVKRMATVVHVGRDGAKVRGELLEPSDATGRALRPVTGAARCEFPIR